MVKEGRTYDIGVKKIQIQSAKKKLYNKNFSNNNNNDDNMNEDHTVA